MWSEAAGITMEIKDLSGICFPENRPGKHMGSSAEGRRSCRAIVPRARRSAAISTDTVRPERLGLGRQRFVTRWTAL
jgi:hypothetical protein